MDDARKSTTEVYIPEAIDDTGVEGAKDDGSCFGRCAPHGFCRKQKCVCVLAYRGRSCEEPVPLPNGLHSRFEGEVILNQGYVIKNKGINITTNRKAGRFSHGGSHTLSAPLVDWDMASYNNRFNTRVAKHSPNAAVGVYLTPTLVKYMPEKDLVASHVYETCAIVGSGGISMMYDYGAEIDGHDVVLRFNSAPTKPRRAFKKQDLAADFPKHIGTKTSFRFINTQHLMFVEGPELRVQQMQSKNGLFRYLRYRTMNSHSHLVAWNPEFTSYVSSNLHVLPTGGYFAVMFGLQKCARVDLYGFHYKSGHSIPHHYFNAERPKGGKAKIHDYAAEARHIQALARGGFVNLIAPCSAGCEKLSGIPCRTCAPGSACVCGDDFPTPSALPGFCHLRGAYSCFYKCPPDVKCRGGPGNSRCPQRFTTEILNTNVPCAAPADLPRGWDKDLPSWAQEAYVAPGGAAKKTRCSGPRCKQIIESLHGSLEKLEHSAEAGFNPVGQA